MAQFNWDQSFFCFSPLATIQIFPKKRSYGGHGKGSDFVSLSWNFVILHVLSEEWSEYEYMLKMCSVMCWWLFRIPHVWCDTPTKWKQTTQNIAQCRERADYSTEQSMQSFFTLHLNRIAAAELTAPLESFHSEGLPTKTRGSITCYWVVLRITWTYCEHDMSHLNGSSMDGSEYITEKWFDDSFHNPDISWSAAILKIFPETGQCAALLKHVEHLLSFVTKSNNMFS